MVLSLIIELVFGGWVRSENNLTNVLGIQHDLKTQFRQELYKGPEIISYSRDKNGLRGISSFNEPTRIGMLTIGGSTTDQLFITDTSTWQEKLEQRYRNAGRDLSISNAGVNGQSTFGHIKNFIHWFPRIEGLKPRYIVFYIGINDVFRFHDESKYDVMTEFNLKGRIIAHFRENSAIYNLYRRLKGSMKATQLMVAYRSVDFTKTNYVETSHLDSGFYANYDRQNVPNFKNRVRQLIDFTESMGATSIFVTQPARYYRREGDRVTGVDSMGLYKNVRYTGMDLYKILLRLNKAMREVAGDKYQVVELSDGMSLDDDDFYDFVHMTPKGTEKLADSLFKKIRLD